MSYCAESDVLDVTGLDVDRIIELSDRHGREAQVTVTIADMISKATKEVQKQLKIPIRIHKECHIIDDELASFSLSPKRVYLGSYDGTNLIETYRDIDEQLDELDVQDLVTRVLKVYVDNGWIKPTSGGVHPDDSYTYSWSANNGYIEFAGQSALVDGNVIEITYLYDPYLLVTPVNIEEATACLAGIKLIDMLRGIRQADTDFDAQSESGVSNPTRDILTITRSQLKQRYRDALASEGYGFDFRPIKG